MGTYTEIKDAASLAFQHRKAIQNGDLTPFIPAFAMAISKDMLFDIVPVIGKFFGVFIAVYLFIFLWGKGKWKVRLVIFALSLFDLVPMIDLIPFSTVCVAYAYKQAKAEADEGRRALVALEGQSNALRIREYQMARAVQEAKEMANVEQGETITENMGYGRVMTRKVV